MMRSQKITFSRNNTVLISVLGSDKKMIVEYELGFVGDFDIDLLQEFIEYRTAMTGSRIYEKSGRDDVIKICGILTKIRVSETKKPKITKKKERKKK